jgi:hypothetical protein
MDLNGQDRFRSCLIKPAGSWRMTFAPDQKHAGYYSLVFGKEGIEEALDFIGASGRTRTCNLLIRSRGNHVSGRFNLTRHVPSNPLSIQHILIFRSIQSR